jgi:hypothetical protein
MKNSTILIIGVLIIIAWVFYNQKQESLSIIQNPITFTQYASLSELNQPLKVNFPSSVSNNTHILILGSFTPTYWSKKDMTHFYITQYVNDSYIHLYNPSSNADEESYYNEQNFTFNFIAIPIQIPINPIQIPINPI